MTMSGTIWILLAVIWGGWATLGVLSAFLVGKFYSRLMHPRRDQFDAYRPKAVVIVPFKGLEPALEEHLDGLCSQDYQDYQLLLVVESEEDPAHAVLERFAKGHPDRASVLRVGPAGPDEGQKVHNHLAAIEYLEQAEGGEEVWVFADSDAVPGADWLGDLVGPLVQPQTGVTTGYRWLIPEPGREGSGASVWSHLASILNASAAGFSGRERQNHAWGGSMAMRVDIARELGLKDWLAGSLSDDYQVTRMVRASGLRIYFVIRCLVPSPVALDFAAFSEFAYRQYLITRVYARSLYLSGLTLLASYQLGFWTAVGAMVVAWVTQPQWWGAWQFWLPAAAYTVVAVSNQVRATIRWLLTRRAFGRAVSRRMRVTHLIDRFATPVWMTMNFLLIVRAGFGNTITWRGITYRMRGPQQIDRIRRRRD